MISKLIKIANKLDALGQYDIVYELDEIIVEAVKDKAQLESALQEVDERLNDPDAQPERLRELHETKKNLENDLAALQSNEPEDTSDVTIGVNKFVTRQTPESKYSHYDGSFDELANLTKQHFGAAKPGYQEGVMEVPVPPERFFSSVMEIQPGTEVVGKFEARREGELPHMQLSLPEGQRQKIPAKSVNVIVYNRELLERDNEESTGADWDIISINASPWDSSSGESEPINPNALMRNYFGEPGGSPMEGTSAEQFVQMLKKSRDYWRDKIML